MLFSFHEMATEHDNLSLDMSGQKPRRPQVSPIYRCLMERGHLPDTESVVPPRPASKHLKIHYRDVSFPSCQSEN